MNLVFSTFREMLVSLTNVERRKIASLILSQSIISGIDVIAIGLLSGILLSNSSGQISSIFSITLSEQAKFVGLGVVVILFTVKGFLSYLNYLRLYSSLETLAINKSVENFKSVDNNEGIGRGKFDSTEVAYAVTVGTVARYLDFFGSAIILINEVTYLAAVLFILLIFQPIISLTALVVFGSIMIGIHKITREMTHGMGEVRGLSEKNGIEIVQQYVRARREIFVYNLREQFFETFLNQRRRGVEASSKIQIAYLLPKYIFESGLMISGLMVLLMNILLLGNSLQESLVTLSVFLGAASRLTPSVLRIQFYKNFASNSLGLAKSSIEIFPNSTYVEPQKLQFSEIKTLPNNSNSLVRLNDIRFTYPESTKSILSNVNFEIHRNSFNCIVGPSGSGKSTLLDILLGLSKQDHGVIEFSTSLVSDGKLDLQKIGYVPQKISIFEKTILYNITLKDSVSDEDLELLTQILSNVQLTELVAELPQGVSTPLTENGGNLSGGQLQRIGIARALFRKPEILILDEATNALDSQTEKLILQNMLQNRESTSVLLVSHNERNSKLADQVLELRNGSIR